MTDLSPDTRAVLDAAAEAMECPDSFLPYERDLMAAAFRAAAKQLQYSDSEGRLFIYVPELIAVAEELEGQ